MRAQGRAAVPGEAEGEDAGGGQPGAVDGERRVGQAGGERLDQVGRGGDRAATATAAKASASRGSVEATRARTGSPGAAPGPAGQRQAERGTSTNAIPSSMSSVAANSGTVHATRKASVSLPAPNSCASAWSRTSPSSAPATERTAVTSVGLGEEPFRGGGELRQLGGRAPGDPGSAAVRHGSPSGDGGRRPRRRHGHRAPAPSGTTGRDGRPDRSGTRHGRGPPAPTTPPARRHTAVSTVVGPPMSAYTKSISSQTSSPQATSPQSSPPRRALAPDPHQPPQPAHQQGQPAAARAARSPIRPCSLRTSRYMLCGESSGCFWYAAPAPADVAAGGQRQRGVAVAVLGEALQPDAGQRVFAPHADGGRPHGVPVGDRLVGGVGDLGDAADPLLEHRRTDPEPADQDHTPRRPRPRATFSARRSPASTTWIAHATAVAIHAPRLKDTASGSTQQHRRSRSATARCRAASAPAPARPRTPARTTPRSPCPSRPPAPKVPTARISSPW